jgi:hypothetical protein
MDRLVWLLLDLAAWWDKGVWRLERWTVYFPYILRDNFIPVGDGLYRREPFMWVTPCGYYLWDGWKAARYV